MQPFDALYASYYDLLYREKDYPGEAEYVAGLIREFAPNAKAVLEFGCGTGRHAAHLAERGFAVTGIDMSQGMLAAAERQRRSSAAEIAARLSFAKGDIREFRTEATYDVVTALFHVMSYQVTDHDLAAAFGSAAAALGSGGLFIFDCWYGPAVLATRPELRVKRVEDERCAMTRIAEPTFRPEANTVDVAYQVFLQNKAEGTWHEFKELHVMRYLFLPEIETLLKGEGMSLLSAHEWMTGRDPGEDTWGCCFVARVA